MPTLIVPIENPNLDSTAFDLRSVTERVDLPRKHECLADEEGDGISSTQTNYACQNGCGDESPFMWIAEPGDRIPLQFQVEDLINEDPQRPQFGWYEGEGDYFVRLQVLNAAGELVWQGPAADIASDYHVGFGSFGPYQNITVDVDKLLEQLPGILCWSFRVEVISAFTAPNSANADALPEGTPSEGFSYINFGLKQVLQYIAGQWVRIGPDTDDELWYVANTATYYRWNGSNWTALVGIPEEAEPDVDYLFTMGYRLRKCNEKVIAFESNASGRDCAGFIHEIGRVTGSEINNADYVGYWNMEEELPPYTDPNTVVLNQYNAKVYQLIAGTWEAQEDPEPNSFWVMANDQGFVFSGPPPVQLIAVQAGTILRFRVVDGKWTNIYDHEKPSTGAFQWSFKVAGSVEVEVLPVDRELSENGLLLRSTSRTVARMRTKGVPETVVKIMQAVIASKGFTIDGQTWMEVGALTKNNDTGALWWINSQISREDCSAATDC